MKALTPAELALLPDKCKQDPRVVDLYLQHDFATAYAMHTDLRVQENGYKAAIGNDQDWELEGEKQFRFLLDAGLRPGDTLLEVGCGTGRLARKICPFLEVGGYVGMDISKTALMALHSLSCLEGWNYKSPTMWYELPLAPEHFPPPFSMVFAFSVFIHCPLAMVRETLGTCARVMQPGASFYFSYVPENASARTGLKQFRHTKADYREAVEAAGLVWMGTMAGWPGPQSMARADKPLVLR